MKLTNTLYRMQAGIPSIAPGLCLVVTLGAAAWLHFGGESRGHVVAFAQAVPEEIAPTEIAKVLRIDVSVGDEVVPGQVVALLDASAIDAEIAVARAEMERLDATARSERSVLDRQFERDIDALEREKARQREEHARVNAQAKALESEMTRVKHLVDEQQAVYDEYARLDLQRAAVSVVAHEKPRVLDLLGKQLAAARRKQLNEGAAEVTDKFAAERRVVERNIERLTQRRTGYELRATQRGRVANIEKQPGEVAAAGEAVVRLVRSDSRVVACVPERMALGIREGDAAKLWIRGRQGAAFRGKTVALGPVVTELPARCWATPKTPLWGREATIALEAPVDMLAGQAFDVNFDPAYSPRAPAPTTEAKHVLPSALPMQVPPALAKRSRFEPSGLLARPSEGRYLVMSDDTGYEGNEDVPWIFSMSQDGRVAAEPIRVHGIDALADVEGIAAGDSGEVYLLSSQSFSKKNKRKPARTALLRLRHDGTAFRVDGEVHLAEKLDADTALATALGLPDGTRTLDIEGVAYQAGALFLGLKAPLDARGHAMIWRIASPAVLFEGKPLADAGIAPWANVQVDVDIAGQTIPGGISDLFFGPDGSLAISSTPSTAEGDAGALWRVDAPTSGTLPPVLVRRFPGLKPEGIAPSLSAGKLMVVFDAGAEPPKFEEIPWVH